MARLAAFLERLLSLFFATTDGDCTGGAANCAVNLASLGVEVALVSVVGTDEAGLELRTKLQAAGVSASSLLTSDKLQTTTKVRNSCRTNALKPSTSYSRGL